jgi:hypothetical protein
MLQRMVMLNQESEVSYQIIERTTSLSLEDGASEGTRIFIFYRIVFV